MDNFEAGYMKGYFKALLDVREFLQYLYDHGDRSLFKTMCFPKKAVAKMIQILNLMMKDKIGMMKFGGKEFGMKITPDGDYLPMNEEDTSECQLWPF